MQKRAKKYPKFTYKEEKMEIRRAKPEDFRRISYLRRQTLEKINKNDYPKATIDFLKKENSPGSIARKLKTRKIFVLTDRGKILGSIEINLKSGRIGGLFIDYRYLGKGYGSKLMQFIEKFAKTKGIKKINLHPTKTAYDFYKKLGYRLVKQDIWEGPGFRVKSKTMEKRLT